MFHSVCRVILAIAICGSFANAERYFESVDVDFWMPIDYNSNTFKYSGYELKVKDEMDCRIYYKLVRDNQLVYAKCEYGTYFHESKQRCMETKPTTCETSWESRVVTTTTEEPTTTTESEDESYAITPEPDRKSLCFGEPNGFTYKLPTNCRSYAVCWEGQSHDGECPKGYSYNGEASVCDISNNYKCEADHFCPPTGIHMFQKLGSCSEYNFCFAGVHMTRKCAEGLQFDGDAGRCDVPEEALCYECPVTDDASHIVTYAHPHHSHKYLMCQNGNKFELECSNGLHWNQENQQCILPDIVDTVTDRLDTTTETETTSETTTTSSNESEYLDV